MEPSSELIRPGASREGAGSNARPGPRSSQVKGWLGWLEQDHLLPSIAATVILKPVWDLAAFLFQIHWLRRTNSKVLNLVLMVLHNRTSTYRSKHIWPPSHPSLTHARVVCSKCLEYL